MIRFLAARSFGGKVSWLVTLVSGIAVAGVCLLLSLSDYRDRWQRTLSGVDSQADLAALNSVAPLAFDDREHAREALAALRAAPLVAAAALYDGQGQTFASYRRDEDAPDLTYVAARPGWQEQGRWLRLSMPVTDRGRWLGELQLWMDPSSLHQSLWRSLLLSLGVTALATLLAWLAAQLINRGLLRPINELVRTATQVSDTKDYSLRAAKLSEDELGELTEAFNEMLLQIQQQEMELQSAYTAREQLLHSERAAREEAERASRAKDEFVATLSHELRTPLMPILGWVQVLRRAPPEPARLAEGLEVIERNARSQTRIIEDLLDMSRIVSGKVRLDVQRVNLADVVEAALATVRPAAEAREVRLQSVLDPHVREVRGDPNRLQQIVWNLLSNAIKFTGKGGRVQVSVARVNSHVEIEVSDTGQGISPEFLPHVFERFRQADSTTTRRHGGLGLGLAIVKQLVELHGGSVRAASAGENLGATFTVSLPLLAALHQDEAAAPREHPQVSRGEVMTGALPSLAGLRVLVVDDDADARDLLARVLEQCGGAVSSAASAEEALKLLPRTRAQVLISDIGMPQADGYALIRAVRALPPSEGGTTPAIALTAFARSEDRTRALLAGYQMHIAKPIEANELVAAVCSLAGLTGQPAAAPA